jgi:hypothetical protein
MDPSYIFESPDHGQTVYQRKFGETARTLHSVSDSVTETLDELKSVKLLSELYRASKTNKVLQDALERAIIIYHLTEKDHGKTP